MMIKKLIVGLLLASMGVALAGCMGPTGGAPGNTTLGGAALGGLSGAAIGGLAHKKDRGKGALVGAGLGTLGGALIGSQMENNNMQHQMNQMQMQQAYDQGYRDAAPPPPPPPPYRRSY